MCFQIGNFFLIENQIAAEQTEPNDTNQIDTIPSAEAEEAAAAATAVAERPIEHEQHDTQQLITSNVKVEPQSDISAASHIDTATDTIITTDSTDPAPNTTDLETTNRTEVKNSLTVESNSLDAADALATNADVSSLDAALDNLNDQVTSLLEESNIKSDSPDAPLDEALATLNSEVLGLLKESRKIQDELQKTNETKGADSKVGSRNGSSQAINRKEGNQYFDYNLYRETSASPPPHPLNTYRWEDIRRDKEKVSIDFVAWKLILILKKSRFVLNYRVVILGLICIHRT